MPLINQIYFFRQHLIFISNYCVHIPIRGGDQNTKKLNFNCILFKIITPTEPSSVDIHMCLECLCEFKVSYETENKLDDI
jgi:hypothetical protein